MRIVFLLLFIIPFFTQAQQAVINFNIKNARSANIEIDFGNYANAEILFGGGDSLIPIKFGKAKWVQNLTKPTLVTASYQDSLSENHFSYVFYFRPGDNLYFYFDSDNSKMPCIVKGKGSVNNKPLGQKLLNSKIDISTFKKDTLPNNILKAISERNTINKEVLSKYISTYRPSKDFEKVCLFFNQYLSLWTYIPFKGGQRYNVYKPFLRNESKWQSVEDSLSKNVAVSDDDMLFINEYSYFLSIYLLRIKERVWQDRKLLLDYYNTDSQKYADSLFKEDPENLLQENIILKNFAGKPAEFLTAVLFTNALHKDESNLPEIFTRFKEKYPQSEYLPFIEPAIKEIKLRRSYQLTDEMFFIKNPESYQTFEMLLQLVKGKTVLLDMWGTWCSPCLSELLINSDSIKNHFKDSDLNYLYVANNDLGKEKKWKELIAYYKLSGTHILATTQLTNDITDKVKRNSFPNYIIIRKNGSYELSEAGYPMDRSILIKQLERALKE